MHPLRPDLTERLWECRSLDIRVWVRETQLPLPPLPVYIPRVQPRQGFESPKCQALAVPIERITGSRRVLTAGEMKGILGAPPDTMLIVTSFHLDNILELLWGKRRELVKAVSGAGYDLVTVPDFSLWDGDTRLEHRYNIARSLRMFELLVEAGVPTLLNVSWYLPQRDIDDWASFLRGWPGSRAFSIDLATLNRKRDWAWGIRGLRRLFEQIGEDWEVLVNGVALKERIAEVSRICGHVHLINERPFQLAMSRHMTVDELCTSRTQPTPRAQMDIFAVEAQKMKAAVPVPPGSCRLRAAVGVPLIAS